MFFLLFCDCFKKINLDVANVGQNLQVKNPISAAFIIVCDSYNFSAGVVYCKY